MRKFTYIFLVLHHMQMLLLLTVVPIAAERDFNFNESQVPLLEPKDEPIHQLHYIQDQYAVEMKQCYNNSSSIVLTMVLKNHDWNDLSDDKRASIIDKLSSFFAIPKHFIKTKSVTQENLIEMQRTVIRKGHSKCNSRRLGTVSFMLGCGRSYFGVGAPIAKQINAQIRDGSLDYIAKEKFCWWIIWRTPPKERIRRSRRSSEGSGTDVEDYDDDYEYGDEDEDNTEIATEIPTVTRHAHRHHHVVEQLDTGQDKLHAITHDRNLVETGNDDIMKGGSIELLNNESQGSVDDEIVKSVTQLESVITKTIENTKNIKELPIVESQDKLSEVEMPTVAEIEKELKITNIFDEMDQKTIQQTNTTKDFGRIEQIVLNEVNSPSSVSQKVNEAHDGHDMYKILDMSPNFHNLVTFPADNKDVASPATTVHLGTVFPIADVTLTMPPQLSTSFEVSTILPTLLYGQSNNLTIVSLSNPSTSYKSFLSPTTSVSPTLNSSILKKVHPKEQEETTHPFGTSVPFNSGDETLRFVNINPSTSSQSSSNSTPWTTTKTSVSYDYRVTEPALEYDTDFISNIDDSSDKDEDKEDERQEQTASANKEVSAANSSLDAEIFLHNKSLIELINPPLQTFKESNGSANVRSPSPIDEAILTTSATSVSGLDMISADSSTVSSTEPKMSNSPPMIRTRLQKIAVTSGKFFTLRIPEETFYDNEDNSDLHLKFMESDGRDIKSTSWIQFNERTREIYGVPIDDTVSKYYYILSATDSGNDSVTETVEIAVQQHHSVRSVNHEIHIAVSVNDSHMNSIDWEIMLMKAISSILGDKTTNAIVVREIRQIPQEPNRVVFVYFNETLSTSICPKSELHYLVKRLDVNRLHNMVDSTLSIQSISSQLIGTCANLQDSKPKLTTHLNKNLPPIPRNQVDQVNATVGHLLVYKVLSDTFYDPNDNELSLTLKTKEHKDLSPSHWLQFDSKNHEFYGIPKSGDIGTEQYMLVAKDTGGLSATDALVVVVSHAPKKEFSVFFKAFLAIRHELFNADLQRKFVERIANLFGDQSTQYIQIRSVTTHHDKDGTIVNFYNTSLFKSNNRCPEEQIEKTRSVYLLQDHVLRDRVKKALGTELNITNVQVIPFGSCYPQTDISQREFTPPKADQPSQKSTFTEDYLYTFILPAIIIIVMLLIAALIACCMHRRQRKCGKMELGDEEERKSFRTKGIPVIFQDELDEKPEIGNKSPIILKNEKPPLLPPSYNTSNINGDNDLDEYVPPPAVIVGGRDVRGKSPATPSYRKPPPYVSP